MGLTAKRSTGDDAEKLARATALLRRVRFAPPEVAAAISIIGEVRAPPLPRPRETDHRQIPIPLPDDVAIDPEQMVTNCPLRGEVRCCVCVARQRENEAKGGTGIRKDGSVRKERGVVPEYPSCRTELCAIGRHVRAHLGREVEVRHGEHHDREGQSAAQARWAGKHGVVPTIDAPPQGE